MYELATIYGFGAVNRRLPEPLLAELIATRALAVTVVPSSVTVELPPVVAAVNLMMVLTVPLMLAEPAGPTEPVAPVGPMGPCDPVEPVAPVGPMGPCDPVEPVAPVGPMGPCDPV